MNPTLKHRVPKARVIQSGSRLFGGYRHGSLIYEFSCDMMKGKHKLIYFGLSFCPDICPASLQILTNVLSALGKYI